MLTRSEAAKLVGQPFIDEKDGSAWGCLAPMYEIIPETWKFKYPVSEEVNMLQYFKEHCEEIKEFKDIQYGDILVVKLPLNKWHLMVCLGDGKAIHCTGHIKTEIISYARYKDRVKGIFRYVGDK